MKDNYICYVGTMVLRGINIYTCTDHLYTSFFSRFRYMFLVHTHAHTFSLRHRRRRRRRRRPRH